MKQAYVDANVILRLVTGDPPDMAEKAASVFRQAEDGRLQLVIDAIVLAECVWVLSSFYGFVPADIAPILRMLLISEGIVGKDTTELLQALTLYEEKNIDFADALLAVRMLAYGVREVYSFDEHFDRIESLTRTSPE